MTATDQDIEIYERESKVIDPSPLTDENGNSIDLTGADLQWKIIEEYEGSIVSKSTSEGGITITDASNGKWQIELASSDTEGYGGEYYEHEARLTDSSGNESIVVKGEFHIKQSDT